MATISWTFLGDVPSLALSPALGHIIAGWANYKLVSNSWSVTIAADNIPDSNSQTLDLICNPSDKVILGESTAAGLACWCMGRLVVVSRVRFCILDRLSIWHFGGGALLASAIPRSVALELNRTALDTAITEALVIRGNVPPAQTLLNPLIYHMLPRFADASRGQAIDVIGASLFLFQLEQSCKSNMNLLLLPTSSCLGSSSIYLNAACRLTDRQPPPTGQQRWAAPGAIIAAADVSSLMSTLIVSCKVNRFDSTLIIAPRFAYPQVRKSLLDAGLLFAHAPTLGAAKELLLGPLPPILLLSLELMQCHDPFSELCWDRCFLLSWQLCSDALTRCNIVPKAFFKVGLCLSQDEGQPQSHQSQQSQQFQQQSQQPQNSELDFSRKMSRLCLLFSIPRENLCNPEAIHTLISSRIHRLVQKSQELLVVPYRFSAAPAPSEIEIRKTAASTPLCKARSHLLGGLLMAKGPFPWVQDCGDMVACFFSKHSLKQKPTGFSSRSYTGNSVEPCPICFDSSPDTVTSCGHWFCAHCLLVALMHVPACPICKAPTNRAQDVVSIGRPLACPEQIAYIDCVAAELKCTVGRIVVLCSYGELHEKFASALRSRLVPVVTWCGNARQIQMNYDRFLENPEGVLLVDPVALSLRWTAFAAGIVSSILVLSPLSNRRSKKCCQLREVLRCCGTETAVVLLSRTSLAEEEEEELSSSSSGRCLLSQHCPCLKMVVRAV
jgi:hypothetical protein